MAALSTDLSEWAAHRRAVVFTVSRRVPGVDPELAASRGLEALCREIVAHGAVDEPVAFWSRAAVDAALAMVKEAAAAPRFSLPAVLGTLPAGPARTLTAPVARALDFERLQTAMEKLPTQEQELLWDRHVQGTPVERIASRVGVLPYAARRRLRRAENRLAAGFAEAHALSAEDQLCRSTRAAMHDYIRHRLLPRRQRRFEDHMTSCSGCTRAFVDVRESYWMLRAAAPVLLLGTAAASQAGSLVAGAAAGATGAAAVGVVAGKASGAGLGGLVADVGHKVVVAVRSVITDPVGITAALVGGVVVTSAGVTGLAYQADALTLPFVDPPTAVQPAPDRTEAAATPSEDPAAQVGGPVADPAVTPAPPGEALPAPLPLPSVAASLGVELGTELVDVEAGVGVGLDDGTLEANVTVRASGSLLALAYKIVPLDDAVVKAVKVNEDLAVITKVGGFYYVIPLKGVVAPGSVEATVTLVGPGGAGVDLSAVSPREAEQLGLADLITALLGSPDGKGGLLGGVGGVLDGTEKTVDGVVGGVTDTVTGTTDTVGELTDALTGKN
ncbi:sigma factor-like helix-turn-helix DNA-binding protein [Antribacter gilvus]|uniref:sigma factor-like helix-turn-helix DNA-binding protein n=1 Tax=Antribacter gilvus TaxID=2304675 RepID=UPI000F7715D9|nr:zf-HC2 domain-containing protein [Antribacter gilvus]